MKDYIKQALMGGLATAAAVGAAPALADSIDPASYSATLGVGESVTISKTVTIDDTPTSSLLDVMFLFDVTGSMGAEISAAKSRASEILTGLSGFGNLASGTGWYSDIPPAPGYNGVHTDISTNTANTTAGINDMWDTGSCTVAGSNVGCGGDFAELGYAAIEDAANNASWRPGSNRFIVALGDASFKTPPSEAETVSALDENNATFLGVSFSSAFTDDGQPLADATGGSIFSASGTSGDSIAEAILDGVTASFSEYSEVTLGEFGAAPGVGVSVTCTSAAAGGTCVGDTAVGDYDRSDTNDFTYDVMFTGLVSGDHSFTVSALVDGGIAATENDTIRATGDGGGDGGGDGTAEVPEPGTLALLGLGLVGLAASRRRAA